MPLLSVLLGVVLMLAIIGVALWALNTFAAEFIEARILRLINNLVFVVVIIWLLIGALPADIRIGRPW